MSITGSSVSMTRYQLLGPKKRMNLSDLSDMLAKKQAKNVKISGVFKDLIYGWVRPIELCDESVSEHLHWDLSDCRIAEGYLLRIRIEKRQVPTKLMQLLLRERIAQKEAKSEEPISRKEKRSIKEELKNELVENCLPQIGYVDAFWNEKNRSVHLYSTTKRHQEIFESLFRETFLKDLDLSMVRVLPPLLGLLEDKKDFETLPIDKITVATPTMMG